MAYLKINGFHTSVNSYADGIGDWLKSVDAAGVPFTVKCVRGTTGVHDALQIMSGSNVPHNIIYRQDYFPHNQGGTDIPDYSRDPVPAAVEQWESHVARFPPELPPAVVWSEIINEPAKEVEMADWIGRFCFTAGMLALEQGYKFIGPGYSTGTPEVGAWDTDGMLMYLELCAKYPDKVGIALHEYSLSNSDIFHWGLVGRYKNLLETCDQHGIDHPTIFISEWGWHATTLPEPEIAIPHIIEAGEVYAQDPCVKGAVIWAAVKAEVMWSG